MTSDSVGTGIRQLARYYRLVGNPVVIDVREDADPIRIEMTRGGAFSVEYSATLMAGTFATKLTGASGPRA